MNEPDDDIEELGIFEYHVPELPKQVEQIATELLQTAKLIGYKGNPNDEVVMEHYGCSTLAANAAIALYHEMCEKEEIAYREYGPVSWLRRKLGKSEQQEHGERSDTG